MLGGLDKATEGSIQIGKNNLSKFSETQMNKYHATFATFIFQDYHLFDNLTVEENVFLGHDLSVKKKKFNIDELLEQVGLQGYAKKYPTELSGGTAKPI
jgi:ABC-type lipoprotein export system ATPase subunit